MLRQGSLLVAITIAVCAAVQADSDKGAGGLAAAIAAADDAAQRGQVAAEKVEEMYLGALGSARSPQQIGAICARIARMYASLGAGTPDLTELYSEEALHCPLPPETFEAEV